MPHRLFFSRAAFLLLASSLPLLACAAAPARAPELAASGARPVLPACSEAPPGSRCVMTVADGDQTITESCTREPDGIVACDGR